MSDRSSRLVDLAAIAGFVLCLGVGIAAATFLTIHGHPWMALLVLLIAGSVSFKTGSKSHG